MINIGVFDSGIGGQAIAKVLRIDFPDHKIIVVNDKKNVPYGDKSDEEIINLTDAAIQPLLKKSCKVIVIACNTATAIAIKFLRKKYPNQHFIGIEPMIKTAEKLSKNRIITVCATPATLRSKNYHRLKNTFGKDLIFFEPDCSNWARMIEDNNINHSEIKKIISKSEFMKSDVIILGCTHYHWIKEDIIKNVSHETCVIEPSKAISKRVAQLLKLG